MSIPRSLSEIEAYLATGAPIDGVVGFGQTMLEYAIQANNIEVVEYLLNAGAQIEHRGFSFRTPLATAVHLGKVAIVELLLARGANLETPGEEGKTALHYACIHLDHHLIALLCDRGADVNALDNKSRVPLSFLLSWDRCVDPKVLDSIRRLCHAGADIHQRDSQDRTPLTLCAQHPTVERELLLHSTIAEYRRTGNLCKHYQAIARYGPSQATTIRTILNLYLLRDSTLTTLPCEMVFAIMQRL